MHMNSHVPSVEDIAAVLGVPGGLLSDLST